MNNLNIRFSKMIYYKMHHSKNQELISPIFSKVQQSSGYCWPLIVPLKPWIHVCWYTFARAPLDLKHFLWTENPYYFVPSGKFSFILSYVEQDEYSMSKTVLSWRIIFWFEKGCHPFSPYFSSHMAIVKSYMLNWKFINSNVYNIFAHPRAI